MEACHSPQQSNVTSYGATTLAIISLEAFAGMWINAFLVCVLCIAWVKKKTLNSNEKILLLLGCSRFCSLCFSWVYYFLSIIYPNYLYVQPTQQLLVSFRSFFNYSDLWVSACLCGFYCIKIANFRNRFFIYLKVKIDRIVPWLLLGSEIFSLVIGIFVYDISDKAQCNNSTGPQNLWKVNMKIDEHFFPLYFVTGLGFVISFTTVISSALFLLFSLWRHKCKMQTNSINSLSTDAHIKAMKSILSFFIMYSINFIFFIAAMINSRQKGNPKFLIIYVFLFAFLGLHSIILILSNPKLEKTLLRICHV
ncbi:taste receptor type 2 member 7-like [Corvus moneduloides]|uniref:taste receptor type 2 member 7-like n=1 Tax=Corvus moneduloides TaxID=1196302 RepID=UPI0013636367|nr:taste receptor type 2 member 7-like [Corvus moneduloides]